MAIIKLQAVTDYGALNVNRTIYPDYQCNCTKYWREDDKLVVYRAGADGVEKIFEGGETGTAQVVETVIALVGKEVTKKAIIAGAHTVVNLKDRFEISDEVLKSADIAFGMIARLQAEHGKRAEFLVPLNDFYMEKDAGTDEGNANAFRKEALDPYVIPPALNERLVVAAQSLGRDLPFHYCSEKNMADRFKRHIKSKKKDGGMFEKRGENWEMVINGERFAVLENDNPDAAAFGREFCCACIRCFQPSAAFVIVDQQMATLIGPHRPIDQVAAEAGTIPYEVLTSLGGRVVREYRDLALAA